MAVFVDTNVFVYARDTSEPEKQAAAEEWVSRLWVEQRGRTSVQVLSEFYVTVTRKLKPGLRQSEAWKDVSALLAWEPRALDRQLVERAREVERRWNLGWWDALIVAAAQEQDCSMLLTEDLGSGTDFDGTVVVNPFSTRVAEGAEIYSTEPTRPISRHRPRGRPSRKQSLPIR